MRQIAFILSLFILALSFVPCSDDDHCDKQETELSSDHDNHDHKEDSCTPFCSCSCCGNAGLVLSAPTFYSELQAIKISTPSTTVYKSEFISSYYYFFWQPPKV